MSSHTTKLGEHYNEIRRRSSMLQDGAVNRSTFERVEDDGLDDPFVQPEQAHVVFTLSSAEFGPVPTDLSNPAVCIYGVFPTIDDAHAHARVVQSAHPDYSILVDSTHKWIVGASTVAHLTDAEHIRTHTARVLDRVADELIKNDEDFERNVRERTIGTTSSSTTTAADKPPTQQPPPTPPADACQLRIHPSCRLAEQRYVALTVVPDEVVSDDEAAAAVPQFLFRVYACYETEAGANRYVRNTCGEHVVDYNIDVVKTCSWVYPQSMKDGKDVAKEVYRSSELDRVMSTHKKNPQEVERFYNEHPDAVDGGASLAVENGSNDHGDAAA